MVLRFETFEETLETYIVPTKHIEEPYFEHTVSNPTIYDLPEVVTDNEMLLSGGEYLSIGDEAKPYDDKMLEISGPDEQEMLLTEPDSVNSSFIKTTTMPQLPLVIDFVDAAVRLFICDQPSGINANVKILSDRRLGLLSNLVPALFRLNHMEVKTEYCPGSCI